jgi:N-acetylglutamate synthase-like GNAT family acetyltransferase
VILRDATGGDESTLASFDVGGAGSPWLDEVAEIVTGLIAWQRDPDQLGFDRRIVVAEVDGEVVAVAAHERVDHELLGPLSEHRYLMVVAVRADCRRTGAARVLAESLFADMQRDGVRTVRWLVHPRNFASIAFSRSVFPEADETVPPEDRPYVSFVLSLLPAAHD